jgi:integrase
LDRAVRPLPQTPRRLAPPNHLGAPAAEQFLTHLAVEKHVSASTQNQALAALLFLYRDVLKIDLGSLDAVRARRSRRLPVILSRDEVGQLLDALDRQPSDEPYPLMARLMYGAGLRLMEACRLRVKDVDLTRNQLTVRRPTKRAAPLAASTGSTMAASFLAVLSR